MTFYNLSHSYRIWSCTMMLSLFAVTCRADEVPASRWNPYLKNYASLGVFYSNTARTPTNIVFSPLLPTFGAYSKNMILEASISQIGASFSNVKSFISSQGLNSARHTAIFAGWRLPLGQAEKWHFYLGAQLEMRREHAGTLNNTLAGNEKASIHSLGFKFQAVPMVQYHISKRWMADIRLDADVFYLWATYARNQNGGGIKQENAQQMIYLNKNIIGTFRLGLAYKLHAAQ